ncbi:uncharacterized protein [Amphiura filiformis]|uniref:uncharacterized protein n=1 Tax=Amphiura filiformis TaxID=82378 RepID=UPI003B21A5C6
MSVGFGSSLNQYEFFEAFNSRIIVIKDMAQTYFIYLCVIFLFVGNIRCDDKPLISNKSFFNLQGDEDEVDVEEAHSRVRRGADVSAIRHLYDETRINNHTQEEKDAILAKHIEYRSTTTPEASNMEYMTWNDELERTAGLWASVCFWGHGRTNVTTSFDTIGQNLWLGGYKPGGVNAITAWYNEDIFYDYEDASCEAGRLCGHYTQVVWAKSMEVGCSRAFCAELIDNLGNLEGSQNKWIENCHYAPAGNYVGQRPFQSGPSCTECQSGNGQCYNKACRPCSDHSETCECRQVCNNCGTLTSNCTCACMDGWYGPSCSSICQNNHENCGKSPGWPGPYTCPLHPAIPKNCPLMCGLCEPAGDEVCGTTQAPTTAPDATTVTSATTPSSDHMTNFTTELTTSPYVTESIQTTSTSVSESTTTQPTSHTTYFTTELTTSPDVTESIQTTSTSPSESTTIKETSTTTHAQTTQTPEGTTTLAQTTQTPQGIQTTQTPQGTTTHAQTTQTPQSIQTTQTPQGTTTHAQTTQTPQSIQTTQTPQGIPLYCQILFIP